MKKMLVLCLLMAALFAYFRVNAYAETLFRVNEYVDTVTIVMDTWETGTVFETGVPEEGHIRVDLWDGMAQGDKAALPQGKEYVGIWLSGWMLYHVPSVSEVDNIWLIDAPPGVYLSSRLGREDPDLPNLCFGKERICLYIVLEKEYAEAGKIEEALRRLNAAGTATFGSSRIDTGQYELDFDFSQIHQREFYKEANVSAKIEKCEKAGEIDPSDAYSVAYERIQSDKVSYWIISGKIESDIPIYNIHANERSEDLDITYFEEQIWCTIRQDFQSIVVISYEIIEPTYEEVVRMLKEAKLSSSFSPEPLMIANEPERKWGEFGPHYYIPFDLSALEK